MKLLDLINADIANCIHSYRGLNLKEFSNNTLTIKCADSIQASNLAIDLEDINSDLELDWTIAIYTKFGENKELDYYIDIK